MVEKKEQRTKLDSFAVLTKGMAEILEALEASDKRTIEVLYHLNQTLESRVR